VAAILVAKALFLKQPKLSGGSKPPDNFLSCKNNDGSKTSDCKNSSLEAERELQWANFIQILIPSFF
jgi:hypothetical protein